MTKDNSYISLYLIIGFLIFMYIFSNIRDYSTIDELREMKVNQNFTKMEFCFRGCSNYHDVLNLTRTAENDNIIACADKCTYDIFQMNSTFSWHGTKNQT